MQRASREPLLKDSRFPHEVPEIIQRARAGSRNDAVRLLAYVARVGVGASDGVHTSASVEKFLADAFSEFLSGVPLDKCLGLKQRGRGRPRGRHGLRSLTQIVDGLNQADDGCVDVRVRKFLAEAFTESLRGIPLESCLGLRQRGKGRPRGRREHTEDEQVEILQRMCDRGVVSNAASGAKRGVSSFAARAEIAAEQVSGNKPSHETVKKWLLEKRRAEREAAEWPLEKSRN